MKIQKDRAWAISFIALYVYLLYLLYFLLADVYVSQGVILARDINVFALISMSLYAMVPACFIPLRIIKPSVMTLWIVYFMVYIPTCIIPILMGKLPFYVDFLYVNSCLLSLFLLYQLCFIRPLNITLISAKKIKNILWFLLFLISLIIFVLYFYYFLPIMKIVGLLRVYNQRSNYTNILQNIDLPGVVYLFNWAGQVFSPLLLTFGVFERRASLIVLGLIFTVIVYAAAALKGVIFLPLAILGLYWLLMKNLLTFKSLSIVCCAILLISFVNPFIAGVFTLRMIVTPGILSLWYVNFSINNPLVYMSNSIFKYFINYPYPLSPSQEVANYNIGTVFDANAHFWASGSVDFGYLFGPLIATAILFVFLWFYDSIAMRLRAHHYNYYLLSGIMLLSFIGALINSAILTALLTSGGLITLLVVYFIVCIKCGNEQ